MTKHYPRVYRLLVNIGHSHFKAAQILLDAMRRDEFALQWIRSIKTSNVRRGE